MGPVVRGLGENFERERETADDKLKIRPMQGWDMNYDMDGPT
jgi:hypothetical protein